MTSGPLRASGQSGRVRATVTVTESDTGATTRDFSLDLFVAAPWYAFAPGATDGLPVVLESDAPMQITALRFPPRLRGKIKGRVTIEGTLEGAIEGRALRVLTQACDGRTCEAPTTTRLLLEVDTDRTDVEDSASPSGPV